MTTAPTHPVQESRRSRRAARTVIISALAVPVLVVGQFAMLAVVPVGLALAATLRDARLRRLRGFAAVLATAYAVPLVLWAAGPDRAPSLSKDMHPVFAALIVVSALATAVAFLIDRRRPKPLD